MLMIKDYHVLRVGMKKGKLPLIHEEQKKKNKHKMDKLGIGKFKLNFEGSLLNGKKPQQGL